MRLLVVPLSMLAACSADVAPSVLELRPDDPSYFDMPRFVSADAVESFESPGGKFRIHFARTGPSAAPDLDSDTDGTPDYVETVADVYDDIEQRYHDDLGFRTPLSDESSEDNGGDGRFDVYLVDFAGRADGAYRIDGCLSGNSDTCAGFMLQENDFVDYGYPSLEVATRILATHEYFHAIQAAYDHAQSSVFTEGTAVWGTEQLDGTLRDYESFLPSFFERPERSLVQEASGPFEAYSYGSAVFFEFLTERFGDAIVRELIEDTENGSHGVADPIWYDALDALLARDYESSFETAYLEFVDWNLATGRRARADYGYAAARTYPLVATTPIEAPFYDDSVRVFPASARYYEVPVDSDELYVSFEVEGEIAVHVVLAEGDVLREPIVASTEPIATDGADTAFVAVVNAAHEGQSERGSLCVRASLEDPCGEPMLQDASVPDDASPDAGVIGGDDDDDGCAVRDPRSRGASSIWMTFLLALLVFRRARPNSRR